MANPTILAGDKAALFPIPMQSTCILKYMPSVHISTVMRSPGSGANDPF